jgi:hypothetical protein
LGLRPKPRSLTLSGQDWIFDSSVKVGRECKPPAPIPAAGAALGSLSSVALSSARLPEVYLKPEIYRKKTFIFIEFSG